MPFRDGKTEHLRHAALHPQKSIVSFGTRISTSVVRQQFFHALDPTRLREANERIFSIDLGLLEFGRKDGIDAWSVRHEGTSLEPG